MDRNGKILIHWVGVGILGCGLIMLFNLILGRIILNFIFLFYILVRSFYFKKIWKGPFKSVDKQRFILLSILSILVLLNFIGMFESYFSLIFIIMLEYLLIINRENQEQKSN